MCPRHFSCAGPIPNALGALSEVQTLWLADNQLSGKRGIPPYVETQRVEVSELRRDVTRLLFVRLAKKNSVTPG